MTTLNVFTIIFVLYQYARDIGIMFRLKEARAPTSGTVKVYTNKRCAVKLGRYTCRHSTRVRRAQSNAYANLIRI